MTTTAGSGFPVAKYADEVSLDAVQRDCAARLGAATLHEAAGKIGALPSQIRQITAGLSFAGRALTVSGPGGDNLWLHRALLRATVGDVLVASVDGVYEHGYWGEVMSVAARARGVSALVIDGCVRDGDVLAAVGVPVFARGLCIRGTRKDPHGVGAINEPVTLGAVTVRSGDLVAGDADGVVVVPGSRVAEVLAAGTARVADEARIMDRLRRGESSVDLLHLPKETSR
jgi:4-hydroxy-4-methyl-2-oxoglutarate aldolase